MNSSNSKDNNSNYSLLNEEKKAKIMQNLREEIDKQKIRYSMNDNQIKDVMNNNSNLANNSKNLNLNNNQIESDNEEVEEDEEHMEILNNAKNVLNQIQDDINKFTQVYGIEQIMPKNANNNDIDINNNNYNDESETNSEEEKNNNKEIYNNINDLNKNNENNEDEINYEQNEEYQDEDDDNNYYNVEENEDNEIQEDEDDINYNYEQYNYNNNDDMDDQEEENNYEIKNKNNSIKFNNNNLKEINTLYQPRKKEEYHYLESAENHQNKYNINPPNNNNLNNNYINYSIQTQTQTENENKSKGKYNFDNPLGYDNEFMINNLRKYSSNKSQKSIKKNNSNVNTNTKTNEYLKKLNKQNKPKYKKIKKLDNTKKINISSDNIFNAKNKEKFENMKKELEDKFASEHPFKPKINKNYNTKIKLKNETETEQERYKRLSRPKIFDLNEKKRKKDLENFAKFCEKNKKKEGAKINPVEVANRLYNQSKTIKIKKDKIKQNYEETQNKEYSFTPEINTYSKILMEKYDNQKKPIYERNEDFEKQKTDNIIKMRQEIENEQKKNCKPKINSNSRKIAEIRNNEKKYYDEYEDVYDRLYKENINKDTKNLGLREMKECTFTPKLNPLSNYLVNSQNENLIYDNNNNNEDNMKDFLERQKQYEDLKKKKLEKNLDYKNNIYTFKPEINSNSDLLVKCNPERFGEKNFDKYSRLYQDAQRIKIKKEKLENELNSKYDFIPKINELSKYIGRKPDIGELNLVPEKENKNMNEEEEEYDFMPQIYNNTKYKNIQSNYKNDQGILDRINDEVQSKNKKIEILQKMKEKEDISKYNFTPEINKEMPDFENNKPMYMKGMARYLNQMEKARQAKRDKEQREKEVFLTGEGWNKNNGITVPKPFKLSFQKKINEKNRNDNEENKQGYLKPKNNENKNRDIIKKLLNGN